MVVIFVMLMFDQIHQTDALDIPMTDSSQRSIRISLHFSEQCFFLHAVVVVHQKNDQPGYHQDSVNNIATFTVSIWGI